MGVILTFKTFLLTSRAPCLSLAFDRKSGTAKVDPLVALTSLLEVSSDGRHGEFGCRC